MLIVVLLQAVTVKAQPGYLVELNGKIDAEQKRIDMYDGVSNHKIRLSSVKQSLDATEIYFTQVDKIQSIIRNSQTTGLEKKDQLQELLNLLKKIDRSNYYLYTSFARQFYLIERIQNTSSESRIKALLKANLPTALKLIPFYSNKPYAKDILIYASAHEPSQLLRQYDDFRHANYRFAVLNEVAKNAPLYLSYYYGSRNPLYLELRALNGYEYLDVMMSIYKEVGSASKAFMLHHEIMRGEITIQEAHHITRSKKRMFNHLSTLRKRKGVTGTYSIDDELKHLARVPVLRINELHEERDPVRFAIVDSNRTSAADLYMIMTYGEDDIYTSSFLGLFNRMMDRMKEKSSYEFLHAMGMVKFRTFVKECAAYNTLETFVSKMTEWERKALFTELVEGLELENSNLELAVSIADIYGSLKSQEDKDKVKNSLLKVYKGHAWRNAEGQRLYSLLEQLLNEEGTSVMLQESIDALKTLDADNLFKGGVNIQQHFFYDDEDGWASYASFIYSFRRNSANWSIIDKGNYVIIKSRKGNKIEIYANKARKEYDGLEELEALFSKMERFPDVVVHRGHSYYAEQTIASITPSANVVILGSCGGYNNILQVLQFAPDAAIVASKQVGTKYVNDALIYLFNEALRTGEGDDWESIWTKVEARVKPNSTATKRFKDYIPPHKNLGAIIIREYKSQL